MLQVKNLTISFPGAPAPAVKDLSFNLEAGGRMGLLGLSGSGKSLTAMALLGLLPDSATITEGNAWYTRRDGTIIDLFQQNEKTWRKLRGQEISLVFQEPLTALNPVHRVRKQLLEAVRLHCPHLTDEAARMTHLRTWLQKVELGEEQDRLLAAFPHQLSGGQRQRLLIALALLGEPRLLIADEPTTALDTVTEAGILQLLEQLRGELNMASLFITHDLRVMQRSADQLLVLAAGATINRGSAATILALGDQLFEVNRTSPNQPAASPKSSLSVTTAPRKDEPLLTVTDLSLTYELAKPWFWSAPRSMAAVQQVSFTLHPGEWLAIVGPSGCGKTSLARFLAGLMDKSRGTVKMSAAASVALVFQDPFSSLNPAHTVRRALTEVLQVAFPEQSPAQHQALVADLLHEVGLPPATFATRKPAALSGGQRQRVAIARALAGNPTILIADESVSALDAPLRKDILALFDRLRQKRKFGLLFISHDLEVVAEWADSVLIMDNGYIVERGDAGHILRHPQSEMGKKLVAARQFTR